MLIEDKDFAFDARSIPMLSPKCHVDDSTGIDIGTTGTKSFGIGTTLLMIDYLIPQMAGINRGSLGNEWASEVEQEPVRPWAVDSLRMSDVVDIRGHISGGIRGAAHGPVHVSRESVSYVHVSGTRRVPVLTAVDQSVGTASHHSVNSFV